MHDAIAEMLDYARDANMPLAIEPLHPAYAADRACVNTTKQALDICDAIDPNRTGMLGVALDVYHIWWDFELMDQIARAGKDRILAFHVCDWLVPTKDILNDRGMMGDGVIDIKSVRAAVEAQGFAGYSEIEIFSDEWWGRPMDDVLRTCIIGTNRWCNALSSLRSPRRPEAGVSFTRRRHRRLDGDHSARIEALFDHLVGTSKQALEARGCPEPWPF